MNFIKLSSNHIFYSEVLDFLTTATNYYSYRHLELINLR